MNAGDATDPPWAEGGISVVLPVAGEQSALARALASYCEQLRKLGRSWEIVLVPDAAAGGGAGAGYADALALDPAIRMIAAARGWGAAVRAGIDACGGEVICYSNWRRTPAQGLAEMLELSLRSPDVALRANRRTRDTRVQRIGSLMFNLECRFVLQVPAWDINGTPKVFPRRFTRLLELREDGGLIDAEFALVCERSGYPVVEVPVDAQLLEGAGPGDHQRPVAALSMYAGVHRLRASYCAR
jgi:hypothetical protein